MSFSACKSDNDESVSYVPYVSKTSAPESLEEESVTISEESSSVSEESEEKTDMENIIPEIESLPMTFKMTSDVEYKMSCKATDGSPFTLTFDKKSWGTWNIGTWTVSNNRLAGGGTDWEYVFRAGKTAGGWVWSGGNHGNETLVDIKFYDDETSKELVITKGASVDINRLKIVEQTKLHLGDASDTYCDVTRTYTVVGQQITLECTYDFTHDTYFSLSYTCMFPVWKTYGLYCKFNNIDGTQNEVETLKVGSDAYDGKMYKGNSAMYCDIRGYLNEDYSFKVAIFNPVDMTDNFKNDDKTFYWDMNSVSNKLYFSRFSSSKPELVKAGTHWDTKARWEFLIEQD